jgi:alpha-tubulin suppressor-like RCC1 family protein
VLKINKKIIIFGILVVLLAISVIGCVEQQSEIEPPEIYIITGSDYTVAIKADGTLWAWGNNKFGQLGLGDNITRLYPTQVGHRH